VAAHQKSQMISVSWKTPERERIRLEPVPDAAPPPVKTRPVPAGVYLLGATALAGFGAFAVLGLTGRDTQQNMESTCAPSCARGDVTDLRNRFLAADIAAGVGAISAASALVVFLARPEREVPRSPPPSVGISAIAGAPAVQWRSSF
jgi:hypothetical protein